MPAQDAKCARNAFRASERGLPDLRRDIPDLADIPPPPSSEMHSCHKPDLACLQAAIVPLPEISVVPLINQPTSRGAVGWCAADLRCGTLWVRVLGCGGIVGRLVYSRQGEPDSIPCGVTQGIFERGNRAGRCRWLAGFLGNLPFLPPLPSGAAPYSPRFTPIGSQDLDVENRPNISTHSLVSKHVQSSQKGSGFTVMQQPIDKRRRPELVLLALGVIATPPHFTVNRGEVESARNCGVGFIDDRGHELVCKCSKTGSWCNNQAAPNRANLTGITRCHCVPTRYLLPMRVKRGEYGAAPECNCGIVWHNSLVKKFGGSSLLESNSVLLGGRRAGPRWLSSSPDHLPPRQSWFYPRPGHSGFWHVGIVPDDTVGRGFSQRSPVSPTLSFLRCSIINSINLIGSQDLDVKSRLNILTLLACQCKLQFRGINRKLRIGNKTLLRVIEMSMEWSQNERAGINGISPRKPAGPASSSGNDSHTRKFGGDPAGDSARSDLVGGERANRSATAVPGAIEAVRLLVSHQGKSGSITGKFTPGFSHVGIVPEDAADRRLFSGISCCILASIHPHLISASSTPLPRC
ncbi:hypothetical protein PR048_007271 [Dryococelus australis]|uniref:Uncharacterized protein n=1 Tax=Dryococelus australis TaxID=614101 RepID=A0ABQ9IDP9_9NEOP|nr:hypothetical protein PR048_007271 [Dryococelus australis]